MDRDSDFDFIDILLDENLLKKNTKIFQFHFIQNFNGCKTIAY